MTDLNHAVPGLDASRGEVARSLVEILRAYSRLNFNSSAVGDTIEQSLIVSAIIIGQADGRLMTASDIAHYLGMPRPTVVRKLKRVAAVRAGLEHTPGGLRQRAPELAELEALHPHPPARRQVRKVGVAARKNPGG